MYKRQVADYQKAHPEADVIRLGIGDVTLPLAASVTEAMHKAVEEQGHKGTFHGYIPSEQGYEFLRDAIRRYYAGHGVELDMSEIFISDGAKSDLGNLLDPVSYTHLGREDFAALPAGGRRLHPRGMLQRRGGHGRIAARKGD